jgi:hypothetical protein
MVNGKENSDEIDDYELLPHREVAELRGELSKMREFPAGPGRRMQISMDQLADKVDKLIAIFEEAMHELKVEEGGLSFQEKMRPVMERMNKVLDQQAEIASGIVALADLLNDLKQRIETRPTQPMLPTFQPMQSAPPQAMQRQMLPAGPAPMGMPGFPPPPMPPRRQTGPI